MSDYKSMLTCMKKAIELKKINGFGASEVLSCFTTKSLKQIVDDLMNDDSPQCFDFVGVISDDKKCLAVHYRDGYGDQDLLHDYFSDKNGLHFKDNEHNDNCYYTRLETLKRHLISEYPNIVFKNFDDLQ